MTMNATKAQILLSVKTVARTKLDEIRALLGMQWAPRGRVCLTCGAECAPVAVCTICGGKQVNAENLLRAIREISKL